MRAEIIKLRQRIDTTFIYVTHDQTEAMTLGDRIVIMKDGFIQQIGTPQQVFDTPSNLFVAGFIGTPQMNFFDARLQKSPNGDYYVTVDGIDFGLSAEKQQLLRDKQAEPQDITLGVRPEHIMLCAEDAAESHIKATVDVSEMMGSSIHLHVNANGKDVVLVLATVDLPEQHRMGFRYGDPVNFAFGGNVMHLFDAEGKKYQDEYKSLTEKYNAALAKVDDPTITAETKALRKAEAEEILMEIKNIEAAITQFERSARTALLEQQRRHRTNIIKEITELVAKRAQSGGYSMVFDVGADSADRTKILVYTDGKDDLTQDILKQLNANAPADILKQMEESPITSTLNVTDQ